MSENQPNVSGEHRGGGRGGGGRGRGRGSRSGRRWGRRGRTEGSVTLRALQCLDHLSQTLEGAHRGRRRQRRQQRRPNEHQNPILENEQLRNFVNTTIQLQLSAMLGAVFGQNGPTLPPPPPQPTPTPQPTAGASGSSITPQPKAGSERENIPADAVQDFENDWAGDMDNET